MKRYLKFIPILAIALSAPAFTSCFKDEPLNAECDIEQAFIPNNGNWEECFLKATDTLQNVMSTEDEISFLVKKGTDLSHFAPKFQITPGATLSPANGSVQDFTNGQVTYTVTSEDGNWKRQYRVGFTFPPVVYEVMKYDFENYFLNENKPVHKYYVWSDKNDDGTLANNWATGNPGFYMSRSSAKPDQYPSVPVEQGYDGACVKLTTSDTDQFGAMAKMPIAAGNLFIGKFDASQALKDAMKATQFGVPVSFRRSQWKARKTTAPSMPCSTTTTTPRATASCSMATTCRPALRWWQSPRCQTSTTRPSGPISTSTSFIRRRWMPRNSETWATAWPSSAHRA